MASFLDKFKVTTAIDKNTTLDLSCEHITTSDWMHAQPVYIKEMVPGETIKIHQETFTRMASMPVPTYGRGLIHNRAFFIPMRTVMSQWDEFITGATISKPMIGDPGNNGGDNTINVNQVPTIKNSDLVRLFTNISSSSQPANTMFATLVGRSTDSPMPDPSTYDIQVVLYDDRTSQYNAYFKFTNLGRRVMKILNSLGYQPVWIGVLNGVQQPVQEYTDFTVSALPLLAWFKLLLDWYYPSQYVGDQLYNYVDSVLKTRADSGDQNLTYQVLQSIFYNPNVTFSGLVNYDSDYFVSAFDNATGASVGVPQFTGNYRIEDINAIKSDGSVGNQSSIVVSGSGSGSSWTNNNTPIIQSINSSGNVASATANMSQYVLDALKSLTDYMKRHQLVGARAMDRFYARFGKVLEAPKLDRSIYIGADNIPLQFGDVMSHSDTTGATLGAYAGKGIGYGANGNFEYTTDEYGYIVVVSSVVPIIGYYQGVDRTVLHKGRLDFWTPEFDQLGNQAISRMELYAPNNTMADSSMNQAPEDYLNSSLVNGIFGYTPRYSEYKIGRDKLSGDFRYNSLSTVGDTSSAWHLFRNMGGTFQDSDTMNHSVFFVNGADYAQYNRIFNSEDVSSDKFYMIHTFNVTSESPMHSLYDTYKFENEGEAKSVVADVNGVKVN